MPATDDPSPPRYPPDVASDGRRPGTSRTREGSGPRTDPADPGGPPGPAFVVGRGRSGTWLLQALLNRHPLVRLAPEGELLLLLEGRWGDVRVWSRDVRRRFCRDLRRIPRLTLWWGLDLDAVEERIVEREEGEGFAEMCTLLYREHARIMEAGSVPTVLGEKNPGYALLLPSLFRRFPEARVVHMVRDPRDNVLSFRGVEFDLDGVAALSERWRHYAAAALASAAARPDRVRVVRFEDLVREPAATLEEVCRFLGVRFRPSLLEPREEPGAPVLPWNRRITSPPDPARLERWRTELSGADRRLVEARCGAFMERLGYERIDPASGASDRLRAVPGALVGRLATGLERAFAWLPFPLQRAVLARYRSWDDRRPLEDTDPERGDREGGAPGAAAPRGSGAGPGP